MTLGRTFLGAAQAPLGRSSERFSRNLIGDGVRALSAENLLAAVDAGTRALASDVGSTVAEAAVALPMEELRALAEKAGKHQDDAIQAIRRNDLTITNFALPAAAASPTAHLAGVADHFARDKHIRRSLTALAVDIAAWEALLARAADAIDADAALVRRWRWRRVRGYVLAGAFVAIALALAVSFAVSAHRRAAEQKGREAAEAEARARRAQIAAHVDAALSTPDPCVQVELTGEERRELSDAQRKTVDGRALRCAQLAAKKAHDERCARLIGALKDGTVAPAEGSDAPGDVFARVAAHALEPADLRLAEAAFGSCSDTPVAPVWDALAREASQRAFLWGKADGVVPKLAERLALPGVMASKAKQSLGFRAEIVAKRALRSGKTDDFGGARELCGLKTDLGMPLGASCKGLGKQGG